MSLEVRLPIQAGSVTADHSAGGRRTALRSVSIPGALPSGVQRFRADNGLRPVPRAPHSWRSSGSLRLAFTGVRSGGRSGACGEPPVRLRVKASLTDPKLNRHYTSWRSPIGLREHAGVDHRHERRRAERPAVACGRIETKQAMQLPGVGAANLSLSRH